MNANLNARTDVTGLDSTAATPAPPAFVSASAMSRRALLKTLGVIGIGGLAGATASTAANAANAATKKTTKTSKKTATTKTTTVAPAASLTTTTTKALTSAANTSTIPSETAGPFPGDGSNGANVLTMSGVVRSDIRSSFGTSTTVAKGIPLTIKLSVSKSKSGAAPVGYAVYIWHCDIDGNYSMYSAGVTNENYLRGVQPVDSSGNVTFQSIFPAAYSGRWPHIHFEVYPSVASATTSANKVYTSQIALPEDMCKLVYATTGYSKSVSSLAQTSLKTDNVFSDGWTQELATATGNVTDGIVASLAFSI